MPKKFFAEMFAKAGTLILCFFAFSQGNCYKTTEEMIEPLTELIYECLINGNKWNNKTAIKNDMFCIDIECQDPKYSSSSSSHNYNLKDCHKTPEKMKQRLIKLLLQCPANITKKDYDVMVIDHMYCLDFRCKSSSSSSVPSSSSGGVDSDVCRMEDRTTDLEGYEHLDLFDSYSSIKRTVYSTKPAMLGEEGISVSGCSCGTDEVFSCTFNNFGLVHNYEPAVIDICGWPNGYWCNGIESGICDFKGSSTSLFYSRSSSINGSSWGSMDIIGSGLSALNGSHQNGWVPDGAPSFILLYGDLTIPTNVSFSDLGNAILAFDPDFPDLYHWGAYCMGEWVPHSEDCFGTNDEVISAYNDSVEQCTSFERVPKYGMELFEKRVSPVNRRGWCMVGECLPEGCFDDYGEAQAKLVGKNEECIAQGNRPDFIAETIGDYICVVGACAKKDASGEANSSSSSSEEIGECAVSTFSPFQKPANYYDDWVYMGKETYGSRQVSMMHKYLGKFVDALGRVYEKAMGRKMYYARDNIPIANVDLEFDVWARIMKDWEGNDIQMFVKKDDKRGFRKDSSFYYNGYWDVFEFDDAAMETRFRTSSGIMSLRKYDEGKHLREYYRTDEKGDTLESHRYEWKNGRLARMFANGIVRNYIYGKTLLDTVRVVPSDEGFNYHSGYNGTAGKMLDEGEPGYETFSRNPYGHVYFGKEEPSEANSVSENFAFKKTGTLNVLAKTTTYGCIKREDYVDGMPEPRCVRFQENDIPKNLSHGTILYSFPSSKGKPAYGMSYRKLYLKSRCECDEFGKYQLIFTGNTTDERIEVYQNFWKYNDGERKWQEVCWGGTSLKITYNHEIQHIINSRHIAATLNMYALEYDFDTKKECEINAMEEYLKLEHKWNEWFLKEQDHANSNSPKYSGDRHPYACD